MSRYSGPQGAKASKGASEAASESLDLSKLTRDQRRAHHAYSRAEAAKKELGKGYEGYKIAINGLGANILRSGLTGAIAFLERDKSNVEVTRLLGDLGSAGIPGLEKLSANDLPAKVRTLDVGAYMLATREMLRVVFWFRRAVQAMGDSRAK